MSSRQSPPQYVVRSVEQPSVRRRRRWWLALVWALSLVVVGGGVYLATDHGVLTSAAHQSPHPVTSKHRRLRQRVADLSRSLQVSEVATQSLKDTLAKRESRITELRADLAFYSHLIGGGARHRGLRIQNVHLEPVKDSRAWNVTVTLTHNVKRGHDVKGALKVAVEGILHGHLTRLPWAKVSGQAESKGLDFGFRYFEQVHGTLMLPRDFTPNRLRVQADPAHGKPVVSHVSWNDALKTVENDYVQQ